MKKTLLDTIQSTINNTYIKSMQKLNQKYKIFDEW